MDSNSKAKRKEFLKKLPIWDAVDRIDTELGLLEHDFDTLRLNVQKCTDVLEQLPKLPLDGQPKIKSGDRHNVQDIVKLYSSGKDGEIKVRDQLEEETQSASTLTGSSMDMLKATPGVGEDVFAMENVGLPWVESKIVAVYHTRINGEVATIFKLRKISDSKIFKVGKFCVARVQNHKNDLKVPKRVIAGPDENNMISGIIGQDACVENRNRYLVLLDNGSAQYFKPDQVYPILYQSDMPWEDFKRIGIFNQTLLAELTQFFRNYPRRIIVETSPGKQMEVMRHGVYVPAMVIGMDCDIVKIVYKDRAEESLYGGCPRFIKRSGIASRLLLNDISIDNLAPRLVGNMFRYHKAGKSAVRDDYLNLITGDMGRMNLNGTKPKQTSEQTCRKSTTRIAPPRIKVSEDSTTPVVDDRQSVPDMYELTRTNRANHKCTQACISPPDKSIITEAGINDLVDHFRDTSDLIVPLKLGWKRLLVRSSTKNQRVRQITYAYEAPCGRFFSRICDIRRYLQTIKSRLDVDFFTFDREVDLNRTLGERLAYYYDKNIAVNRKTLKPLESKYVSLINTINKERLPADFEYNNETFPHPMLKAKGFSFNEDFKSGCDCDDDCAARANCACHQLNEEAAGTRARNRGEIDFKCQYKDKRLFQQVITGIFECNGFCRCSSKCGNRVVQNGLRVRLQVRKTVSKGWGVYVLDDVPKGSYICTYSAELLDDADQYGDSDMYFADLDYITIVEESKLALEAREDGDEGVGSPDDDDDEPIDCNTNGSKKRVYKRIEETSSSSSDSDPSQPVRSKYLPRYPRREKATENKGDSYEKPGSFKRIHSILNVSQDYTLDARMQGNIGRFFNHSCDPNAFVQNVFIESHDLRFPTVSFFAKRSLKADDEITWNYCYQIGSIKGRHIPCNCGAANCHGRIL